MFQPALLAVAALLAAEPPPIRIAAPNLNYVNLPPAQGDFFLDYFAQQLAKNGVKVTTAREISSLVGLERQKQLLGCGSESASCLAELAGALGVDAVLTGSIARTSKGLVASLKVVRSRDASEIASDSGRLADDDALLDWMSQVARRFGPQIRSAFGVAPAAPLPPRAPDSFAVDSFGARFGRPDVWIPLASTVLLAAGGAGLNVAAQGIRSSIATEQTTVDTYSKLQSRLQTGERLQLGGDAAIAGAVVAAGITAWRLFTPSSAPSQLSYEVLPGPGGQLLVTVGGTLP